MRYLNRTAFKSGKKHWLVAMFLSMMTLGSMAQINTYPYFEDFEAGAGGWVADNGSDVNGWERGSSWYYAPHSGSNLWKTNLDGNFSAGTDISLVSPEFDFSTFSNDPVVFFYINYELYDYYPDLGRVEYTTDGGTNWYQVGSETSGGLNWYNNPEGWTGYTNGSWVRVGHILEGLAGYSNVMIRIRLIDNTSCCAYGGIGIDDVTVDESAIDLEITAIEAPLGLNLGQTEQISFTVKSYFGTTTAFNATINISGPESETINRSYSGLNIGDGESEIFYIDDLDFSEPGGYDITVEITTADYSPDNNTGKQTAIHFISEDNFPYNEDFEDGTGGWFAQNYLSNGWEHGEPEATRISYAYSGSNAWVTNLDGNFSRNSIYYLYSPEFDFSDFDEDPELSFYMYRRIGSSSAYAYMEFSTDGGNSWNVLGDEDTGLNWYNDGQTWYGNLSSWYEYAHLLTGLAGQPSVILRLVLNTQYAYAENEGLGVDDFSIKEAARPDISIVDVDLPEGPELTDDESIFVTVEGAVVEADQIVVTVEMYNPGYSYVIREFSNVGLEPGNSAVLELEGLDFSVKGAYDMHIRVSAQEGDINPNNNYYYTYLFHQSDLTVSNFPYREDFENGEGGWFQTGQSWDNQANDNFALGVPAGDVIDGAASGNNAWKTNLEGPLTSGGTHYLYSPEFDLSSFGVDPYISFNLNYQMNPNYWDYMYLQFSTDKGNSWSYVGGNSSGGINWYNGNYFTGWDESSGGWVEATHVLSSLAGQTSVMFRFVFYIDTQSSLYDGVAIDNVKIGSLEAMTGDDQLLCGTTTLELFANEPFIGAGEWTVESGIAGSFEDSSDPNTTFTGAAGEIYTLRWTVTPGGSYIEYDELVVEFNTATPPTTADAGDDISICSDDATQSTTLNANVPTEGTGEWSFVSGAGATLDDFLANNSGLEGPAGNAYVLRWTITNTAGCTSTDDVRVTFSNYPAKPTIQVESGPTLVASAAHEYEWFRNGQPVSGTGRSLFLEEDASGSYTVVVKVNGCESEMSDPLDIVVTAAENETINAGVSTFPNPVKEKLTINLRNTGSTSTVQLTDTRGLVISEHKMQKGQSQLVIDTSSMSEGLYMVWISSGKKKVCQKVIKSSR